MSYQQFGELVLALVTAGGAVSAFSLGWLLKRALQQAVAEWRLGRSLMKQLDESINNEQAAIRNSKFRSARSHR